VSSSKRQTKVANDVDEWVETTLGKVVNPTRPRISPSERPDLPFIGMDHIEAHTMKLLGTVPAGTMKSAAVHFQPGDVLYGRLRPYLNKVYRATFEGLCSAEFIVFPEVEGLDGRYLQYFLNSSAFVSYASQLNAGDRPRVKFEQLSSYPFPLPPQALQKRIIAEIEKQLSRLDEAVANLKRVKAQLKRYKAAVLKAAVEGKLTEEWREAHPDVEPACKLLDRILAERRAKWEEGELAKIEAKGKVPKDDKWKAKYKEPVAPNLTSMPRSPDNWASASLDQLTSKITSGSRDWSPYYEQGSSIFVLAQNVRPMEPDFSVQQRIAPPKDDPSCDRSRIQAGDLMTTIVGANTGQVCLVVRTPGDAYVCQSVALMRPIEVAISEFINISMNSTEHAQRYFELCMYGQGRPHLSFDQLKATPIWLPPLKEQHRIVAEVDRHSSLIREAETQVDTNLQRAARLRQALMARAFGGGLVPIVETRTYSGTSGGECNG
jgi:type I restriction enzyme, S subunit